MNLKMSSAKWRAFCLGLNVLTEWPSIPSLRLLTQAGHDPSLSHGGHYSVWVAFAMGNLPQWFIRQQETNCYNQRKLESGSLMMQSLCLLQLTYSLRIKLLFFSNTFYNDTLVLGKDNLYLINWFNFPCGFQNMLIFFVRYFHISLCVKLAK